MPVDAVPVDAVPGDAVPGDTVPLDAGPTATAPVDFVVPVFQPNWDCLTKVISAALDQAIPTNVALVLDGPDAEVEHRLYEMSRAEPRLRHMVTPGLGTGDIARLEILDGSTSDSLIFLDDDVVPSPTLAEQHVEALAETSGIVIGQLKTVIPPRGDPSRTGALLYDRWYQDNRQRWLTEPASVATSFWSGNFSARRRTMEQIRTFLTREPVCYSLDSFYGLIATELDIPVLFRDDIVAEHFVDKPFGEVPKIGYAYGSSAAVMARAIEQLLPAKAASYRGPITRVRSFPGAATLLGLYRKHPAKLRRLLLSATARQDRRGNDAKALRYLSAAHVLELARGYLEHDEPNATSADINTRLTDARAANTT